MNYLKEIITKSIKGIATAGYRFPMTVASLLAAALIIFRLIAIDATLPLLLQKLIFTFIVGALLGMVAQFTVERFQSFLEKKLWVYLAAILLLVGYFLILLAAPEISNEITVRSLVAVFAAICIVLWLPSYKSVVDFNIVALVHFKSIFTAILYSGVLAAGLAAIFAAVDTLLFAVASDAYLYMLTVVWVVFAPVYYLSLLPKFNSELDEDKNEAERAGNYPKFLEILISYIAIPLISTYTVVLIIYFLKILFTLTWPSGQIGPMVLIYSIAGLIIFILASVLDNRFALFYRRFFPKALILVVIMQLISVGIRLNSYGVTESRYYVGIFGVFSLAVGVLLSTNPVSKNRRIALLAATVAVISIIPPVDAFTVSRHSQIDRIEAILEAEGMLVNGEIVKKEDASEYTKIETTNILNYLSRSSSFKYIDWLPKDFLVYQDLRAAFGFEPTYPNYGYVEQQHFYASLDTSQPLLIAGYDIQLNAFAGTDKYNNEMANQDFEINGNTYRMEVRNNNTNEVYISILDSSGVEVIGTRLDEFAQGFAGESSVMKELLPPSEMSFDVNNNGYKLKIIFQHININYSTDTDNDANTSNSNYLIYALFATPK